MTDSRLFHIRAHEYEIAENLSQMKSQIDNMLFLNINILDNEDAFKRDVLAIIGHKLIDLGIKQGISIHSDSVIFNLDHNISLLNITIYVQNSLSF